jgi:hypothetical protein
MDKDILSLLDEIKKRILMHGKQQKVSSRENAEGAS